MNFELPKITLLPMSFDLAPNIGLPDVNRFECLEREIEEKIILGQSSSRRARGIVELEKRLRAGVVEPKALLKKPRDIRILIGWWRTSEEAFRTLPFHKGFIEQFRILRPRLSTQALFGLVELYFEQFDNLPDIKVVADYLKNQLIERSRKLTSVRFSALVNNADLLFDVSAPQRVAAKAMENKVTLARTVKTLGLEQEKKGRFFECCQQMYYLNTLNRLEIGEDHRILSELAQKSVHESAYREGLLLGHEIIKQIVDRAGDRSELPDNWLHLLLEIGGDPRIHQGSRQFTRWWARLEPSYIARVRRWLSRMDLTMFLEILEDFSDHSGPAMQRMFPARKRFLLGLFESDLIKDSRLYLSRRAAEYVRRNYRGQEKLAFARNSDAEISVLYVNVDGYHVFEGTHNFSFRLHRELPSQRNPVHDYTTNEFPIRSLGVGLSERVAHETGEVPFSIAHVPEWQHKVLLHFKKLGIRVDPELVLEPEDYRLYKRRHGI